MRKYLVVIMDKPDFLSYFCFELIKSDLTRFGSLPNKEWLYFIDDMKVLESLIMDDTYTVKLWPELIANGNAEDFVMQVRYFADMWSMRDENTPLQRFKSHQKIHNHLTKALSALRVSPDLMMNYQQIFEGALGNANKIRIDSEANPSLSSEHFSANNIHFVSVMSEMIEETGKWNKEDFESSGETNFPRKINEKSAYRTYMVKSVAEYFGETFAVQRFELIADAVNAMFAHIEDLMPIDGGHVQKLLKES